MSAAQLRKLREQGNRCIFCGKFTPEGRQVCPICVADVNEGPTVRLVINKHEKAERITKLKLRRRRGKKK